MLLALLLVPVHLAYGIAWGTPWGIIVGVQVVFLGAGVGAAGLSLLCSAACGRVLHAVALAAAAIVLGWFAALDGLAYAWTATRFARVGHPLRLLDDLVTSSVSVEVAGLRVLAFLLGAGLAGGLAFLAAIRLARCPVQGTALALPGLFRVRPGKTEHVWDDPVYWRECRSRGARRTLRIGGLLILGLAVVLTVTMRDPATGGLWAQVVDLSRELHAPADHGRDALALPAGERGHRRRASARDAGAAGPGRHRPGRPRLVEAQGCPAPSRPADRDGRDLLGGRCGEDDRRLHRSPALVGRPRWSSPPSGPATSWRSRWVSWPRPARPSPRVALLAGPALLFAWDAAPPVVPQVVQLAWPGIPIDTLICSGT